MSDEVEYEVQRTLGRLETKIDALIGMEGRVSALEEFSDRVKGAAWIVGGTVTTAIAVWGAFFK